MMRVFVVLILLISACATPPTQTDATPDVESASVHIKLLAINDFHGHLEGPSGAVQVGEDEVHAGGVENLASTIAAIRKYHPQTVVVGAGDMIGASPLISSLFHDEPAIEALDLAGLEINAVGNHEFDEGIDELLRMKRGGCHPERGCIKDGEFEGANFSFLAANVTYAESGDTIFPAYEIREFEGVKVGFIGLTLEGTPDILVPGAADGLDFADEATTINQAAEELRGQGVEAIVVLLHEGGYPSERDDPSGCVGISGPILEIVENTDASVDVFVTGHTHQPYVCEIDSRLVTSAKAYGQMVTEIDVFLDRETGEVVRSSARNLVVEQSTEPSEAVRSLVDTYRQLAEPLANRVLGTIEGSISRERDASGESRLGRLIADIQMSYSARPEHGLSQIAFMNPGGIRANLDLDENDGKVIYARAHRVQPFGNTLVTMTLTGAELHRLLEEQWINQKSPRILQVSEGFKYAWSESAPVGEKVDPASMSLNGEPIDPEREYRITVNSYLAGGGDNFKILLDGRDPHYGPTDLVAFEWYFGARSPVEAPEESRIEVVE